ncbi:MAG: UDP-glucose 4-epimerase GalE [Lentimicrobiaceae bacterium]|nr:UDP-glucose 4-epimerase GalE [Lentimicrobiaceae bacterium]
MKVLITGGTGYIGSHTIIEMIETETFTPICIDSCERSTPETIDRMEKITGIRVPFYQENICNKNAFFRIFEEHKDIVGIIHFAAFKSVPESVEKPLEYYRNNLQSLENVLEACLKYNIPNLIFSSSCSIYGEVERLPVNENTPMGIPFCPYAHTKQIGEEMIRFFTQVNPQFNAVLLRYFNPVGAHSSGMNGELSPDKPNNLMPIITQVGIGKMEKLTVFGTDYNTRDGSCIRDYVHVSDIADAHVKAMQFLIEKRNSTNCEVFNLGSGNGISVLEMLHAFEEITGVKLNYKLGARRAGDVPAVYSDSTRAEKLLNWQCKRTLADMVGSAWEWEKRLGD